MVLWVAVVLALTLLPGRGALMRMIAQFFGRSEWHGTLGHMALMASLVAVLFIGMSQMIIPRYALLLSVALVFVIGTLTEIAQGDVYGRSRTLADLLGNWVGTFAMGYVFSFFIKSRD